MLKCCVRSASDPILYFFLQSLRNIDGLDDDEIDEITNGRLNNCAFVADWDDFPDDAVKIVPKRESKEELINRCVEKIKNDSSIVKHVTPCYDEHQ